jgi:hypothetical protein
VSTFAVDIKEVDDGIVIVVEAALRREHPLFYWPPREGEVNAYAHLTIYLRGEVEWIEGPIPKQASDAGGEMNYGDLGSWRTDDAATEYIAGEWGRFVGRSCSQTVETLPPAP